MKLFPRSLGAVLSLTMGAGLMMVVLPPAHAATVTFVTPTGASTGGGPVNASATFTTSANQISVSLSNLQANITDVAQGLSDLFFTYSGSNLSGQTLTSSSAQESLSRLTVLSRQVPLFQPAGFLALQHQIRFS